MIRKTTPLLIVFAVLVSITMGAEPQSLLPQHPPLPPHPSMIRVVQTAPLPATQPQMVPAPQPIPTPQPMPQTVPQSTHDIMLSSENGCQTNCGTCPSQPAHFATWWSNSLAGRAVHSVAEDTWKNNQWPEPYNTYDKMATREAFTTMVEKGWKRQNTLDSVHFNPENGDLNMSGRFKIRRIVFQGLPSRRDLFIHRADTLAMTDARVKSVKTFLHQLVGNAPDLPQVSVTNLPALGWPAQFIDAISRKYIETMPDPRIPKESEANFTEE